MALRTVRFFQIVDQDFKRFEGQFPASAAREAIRNLTDELAYMHLSENIEVVGSAVDADLRAQPQRAHMIVLDRITREPHLRIERQRVSRPLILGEGENLAEPTFFAIYDNNVLGVMRNSGTAPSQSHLREYINQLQILDQPIAIAPLIDRGRMRALQSIDRIRKVTFAVGKDAVLDLLPEDSAVRRINRAVREEIGHVSLEVSVKLEASTPEEVAEGLRDELRTLTTDENIDRFSKLEMTYKQLENGRVAAFDFIREALVTQTDVDVAPVTQQPTEDSAAEHLHSAYEELYDEINATLRDLSE